MNKRNGLKQIVPGKNYPSSVIVTEPTGEAVTFILQSYRAGMYCAIYINGRLASQSGDSNNRTFYRKLKKDIASAIARGATVEIGSIQTLY